MQIDNKFDPFLTNQTHDHSIKVRLFTHLTNISYVNSVKIRWINDYLLGPSVVGRSPLELSQYNLIIYSPHLNWVNNHLFTLSKLNQHKKYLKNINSPTLPLSHPIFGTIKSQVEQRESWNWTFVYIHLVNLSINNNSLHKRKRLPNILLYNYSKHFFLSQNCQHFINVLGHFDSNQALASSSI